MANQYEGDPTNTTNLFSVESNQLVSANNPLTSQTIHVLMPIHFSSNDTLYRLVCYGMFTLMTQLNG